MDPRTIPSIALQGSLATALVAVTIGLMSPVTQAAEPMAWEVVARSGVGPSPVREHDVFVDAPTRFAFVKTATGWKFVGQLDATQMSRLPAGTITSLLPPDESGVRLAQSTSGVDETSR